MAGTATMRLHASTNSAARLPLLAMMAMEISCHSG